MPLTRPHFIDKAWPNGIDLRKAVGGYLPREGILPDPVTALPAGIAYANGTWNVGAQPFVLCSKRGGAPYSQSYGTAIGTNDSSATAWVLAANASGSTRVDRLWVRFVDPTQAEALTTPGGETVPRAVPVFGVTAGTPGIQPLPAGAVEIAQVSIPNAAASIAAATITQTFKYAQVVGGTIYVRTIAERDALVGIIEGDEVHVINTDQEFRYLGSVIGWVHQHGKPSPANLTLNSLFSAHATGTPKVYQQDGRVYIEGSQQNNSTYGVALGSEYSIATIADATLRPDVDRYFATGSSSGALPGVVRVATDGQIWWRANATVSWSAGGLRIDLGGINYLLKALV